MTSRAEGEQVAGESIFDDDEFEEWSRQDLIDKIQELRHSYSITTSTTPILTYAEDEPEIGWLDELPPAPCKHPGRPWIITNWRRRIGHRWKCGECGAVSTVVRRTGAKLALHGEGWEWSHGR